MKFRFGIDTWFFTFFCLVVSYLPITIMSPEKFVKTELVSQVLSHNSGSLKCTAFKLIEIVRELLIRSEKLQEHIVGEMDKSSFPDRDILKKIVVEVGERTTRTVTDNSHRSIHLVRSPGEGSRPLFDRDEIINGRRIIEENDQHFSNSYHCYHPSNGNQFRPFYENNRWDTGLTRRINYERYSDDDLMYESRMRRCPVSRSNPYYFVECIETLNEGRHIYQSLFPGRLNHGYCSCLSSEMEQYYPHYYAVLETSPLHFIYDDCHHNFR